MSFARVLERNRSGKEVLWACSMCGQPFSSGWGSQCNRCSNEERRHKELIQAMPFPDPHLSAVLDALKAAQDEIIALRAKVQYQEGVIRQWEEEHGKTHDG